MNATATAKAAEVPENQQSTRETVESVVVAFILAFLFRAFVAEAFVIPTGSMAPTLMGAHKDVYCEHCGEEYQASASSEFDSNTGAIKGVKTLASTCSVCRGINAYDFRENPNHASFSGDRILVSKFDYVFGRPERWDVFVFKYPRMARMNYIKRLIGLPGEYLRIEEGDVFVRTEEAAPWSIARKPPHKIQAMKQIVADTKHQAAELVERGWPSLWQPWGLEGDAAAWTVTQDTEQWSAELRSSDNQQWLRYYHKVVDVGTWEKINEGGQLPTIDPYASQLITDYLAYNSSFVLTNAEAVFDARSRMGGASRFGLGALNRQFWQMKPEVPEDQLAFDFAKEQGARIGRDISEYNDGTHWVGDLCGQFEVEVTSDSGTLLLDLVEFGVHFRCSIDVQSGAATLQALDGGQPSPIFDGNAAVNAKTSVRGQGSYALQMANVDDQIHLWVNGSVVSFDGTTQYDSGALRKLEQRRPYWTEADPLDAAPLGIGGQALAMKVNRAQVFRDIYYIATQGNSYQDYAGSTFAELVATIPDPTLRARMRYQDDIIAMVYAHPEWWAETSLFSLRGKREFKLEEKQYFPMGDNSAASSDARSWYGHHYVEERYLLGKALLVFWPHTWNTPVPFTPNLSRMGLIR